MAERMGVYGYMLNTPVFDIDSVAEAKILRSQYSFIQLLAWYISYNMGRCDYAAYKYCTRKDSPWNDKLCNYMLVGTYAAALEWGVKPVTRSLEFRCSRLHRAYLTKILRYVCTKYRCSYTEIDTGKEAKKYNRFIIRAYDAHTYSLEVFVKARDYNLDKTPMGDDGKGYQVEYSRLRFGRVKADVNYIKNRYFSRRTAEDFYSLLPEILTEVYRSQNELNKLMEFGRDPWGGMNWEFCFPYDIQTVSKLWHCYWDLYIMPNDIFLNRRTADGEWQGFLV